MADQTPSLNPGAPPDPAPATAGLASTPHAVITELSDSEDERNAGGAGEVAPTASTSAFSLDTPATSTEGTSVLRERVRSPYSGQRDTSPVSAVAKGRSSSSSSSSGDTTDNKGKGKGKGREADRDESSTAADPEDAALGTASAFACHICLEVPRSDDAVLTRCGHLYCWTDLSAWLDSNPPTTSHCAVCKAPIKDIQQDVIPIYGGGAGASGTSQEVDPRKRPRPKPKVIPAAVSPSRAAFWDPFAPGALGQAGWSVQAGMFPFPGLAFGWSNQPTLGAGGPMHAATTQLPPGVTQEEAHAQARAQQRNSLIAFVVMIVLFSLLATIGEMD